MLDAVRKMLNPSNNNPNASRGNQAKAVRSSGEVTTEAEGANMQSNVEEQGVWIFTTGLHE